MTYIIAALAFFVAIAFGCIAENHCAEKREKELRRIFRGKK